MEKSLNKYLILVRFVEDNKYDVLRLKKAIVLDERTDILSWNTNTIVDVLWNGSTYPANILQFGENKKEMDKGIDQLADGQISLSDIPVLQGSPEEANKIEDSTTVSLKKQKLDVADYKNNIGMSLLSDVAQKISQVESNQGMCSDGPGLKEKIKKLWEEKTQQESILSYQNERIKYLENKVDKLRLKCARRKEKCKKYSCLSKIEEDQTSIGSSIRIPTNKLNMCRTSGYTKFVGDLLEVVFGRDVLGNSVIKGIKGRSTKSSILDPKKIKDIELYASTKFNVDRTLVRAAIRRKLNVASRLVKETSDKTSATGM